MQSGAIRPIPNMLPRHLFNEEHEAFRETVRKFYEKEVVPNIEKYEKQQHVDRDLWNKAGALGFTLYHHARTIWWFRCRSPIQHDPY